MRNATRTISVPSMLISSILLFGCKAKPALPYGSDMEDAIMRGNSATVRSLLDAGVDPNGIGPHYRTPLCDAVANGSASIVNMLLKAGAKPNFTPQAPGHCNPLIFSVRASNKDSLEIVRALISAGAETNIRQDNGATPLLLSIVNSDDPAISTYLIDHGADPNLRTPQSNSALYYVFALRPSQTGSNLAELMLKHGATLTSSECKRSIVNINKNNYGSGILGEVVRLPACKNADLSEVSE